MKNSLDFLSLSDIGHTNVKIWRDGKVKIIPLKEFSPEKWREKIYYINVNRDIQKKLDLLSNWIDISNFIDIKTDYKTLGIDRKIGIYGAKNEIIVDLGSAITIDLIKDGIHLGGYILLGKDATIRTFQEKTPHLNFKKEGELSNNSIPKSSKDALYFGFFNPIIALIKSLQKQYSLEVILTGGDSEEFEKLLDFKVTLKKNLLFENMKKCINLKQLEKTL